VKRAIAKKNTLFGAESKFAFIIGAKIRPTSTTKSAKSIIVRFGFEEFLHRGL
jgi:hypothetical protein